MRILIDLQSCQSGSRFGGIGRYSMALAKAMISVGVKHEFYILLNKNLPGQHEVRNQLKSILPQHQILAVDIPLGVAQNITANQGKIGQTRLAELVREKLIADICPDVLHISSLIEGFGDEVVTSVGLLFDPSRTVVTLYDLIPLVEHARYLTNNVVETHYLEKIAHMRKAGLLLAISDYSKNEGVDVGKFSSEIIANISSAVDEKFKPRAVSLGRKSEIYRKFNIRKNFLMYVGSFDSRKNQDSLIKAFALTSDDVRSNHQLVIVGNGWADVYQRLKKVGLNAGLGEEAVLFLGHVDDEELIDLYNLCTLFVFPSLREGFGLPVLEAMSCGVPAIGSNTTSVPEVLGRIDATFNPADVTSITEKIQEALSDRIFYDSLKEHALAQSRNFSWEISAIKALDFIEQSVKTRNLNSTYSDKDFERSYHAFLHRVKVCEGIETIAEDFLELSARAVAYNECIVRQMHGLAKKEAKVGWITTWNTRCGIASYSRNLIASVNQPSFIFAPVDCELTGTDAANVQRCWVLGGGSFESLNLAIDSSGIQVLSIQLNYGFYDFHLLSEFLVEQKNKGRLITITLHATVDPPAHVLNRKLSQLSFALNQCDAVLVHSLADVENLAKIDVKNNVVFFPQGVVNPLVEGKSKKKENFKIATYGFALPHKGMEQVIGAIGILAQNGINVKLEMINASYSEAASSKLISSCRRLIDKLSLNSSIELVTEYLDDEDSLERMSTVDVVVFAYQNTTESSSAAVRMGLASGALVAVSPLSIFDDISDCVYILPGTSQQEIAGGISAIFSDISQGAEKIANIRKNSRRWVDSNRFDNVGKYYSNLVCAMLE